MSDRAFRKRRYTMEPAKVTGYLKMIAGSELPQYGMIQLSGTQVSVGRGSSNNDVVLPLPQISNRHCIFKFNLQTNKWRIQPSTTKIIFVNRKQVPIRGYAELSDGDIVKFWCPPNTLRYKFHEGSPETGNSDNDNTSNLSFAPNSAASKMDISPCSVEMDCLASETGMDSLQRHPSLEIIYESEDINGFSSVLPTPTQLISGLFNSPLSSAPDLHLWENMTILSTVCQVEYLTEKYRTSESEKNQICQYLTSQVDDLQNQLGAAIIQKLEIQHQLELTKKQNIEIQNKLALANSENQELQNQLKAANVQVTVRRDDVLNDMFIQYVEHQCKCTNCTGMFKLA